MYARQRRRIAQKRIQTFLFDGRTVFFVLLKVSEDFKKRTPQSPYQRCRRRMDAVSPDKEINRHPGDERKKQNHKPFRSKWQFQDEIDVNDWNHEADQMNIVQDQQLYCQHSDKP